jgi:hypothetical protein
MEQNQFKFRGFHEGKPVFFTFESIIGNRYGVPCIIIDKPDDVVMGGTYVSIHILKDVGQFTGLKDIKGTEIYVGDIMKWANPKDGPNFVVSIKNGQIYFDKQNAVWYLGCVYGTDDFNENGISEKFGGENEDDNDTGYEVVGNIHQNPELLK